AGGEFESQSYPLSINTRKHPKNRPPKPTPKTASKHQNTHHKQRCKKQQESTIKQGGLKRKPSPHWHVMGFRIYVLPSSSPPGGTAQTLNPKPSYMAMAHGVIHHPFQVFEMVSRTTAKSEP
ncbi:hypothetical protein, partial [Escherichia coli]|uniref:hypothetical protein n=1 Tax=Escherichia coli TaxID=562 RepID=UPI001BE3F922